MRIAPDEKSLREQIPYPDVEFPFCVWPDVYKLFIDNTVNAHWHYDFEFGYVVSGFVDYYINNTHIRLQPGDCIFVNSNMLHMSRQPDDCDNAIMFTITFPTSLLTPDVNSTIYKKYFQPILETNLEGFIISPDHPLGKELATLLIELLKINFPAYLMTSKTISSTYKEYYSQLIETELDSFMISTDNQMHKDVAACLKENARNGPAPGFELECVNRVFKIIAVTLSYIKNNGDGLLWHTGSLAPIERAKEILYYIHEHYREKITIEDLVEHLGFSRSECFRCFRRFTGKNPVEYLNEYRLSKAVQLLRESEKSIEDISGECGFASASYFTNIFKGEYNKTPLQFRRYG